jgi:bacterioferritin (cytochrome b1)
MISYDYDDELKVVRDYNEAIKLAHEVDDQGSVDLLIKILKMEEGQIDWAEIQLFSKSFVNLIQLLLFNIGLSRFINA